MVQKCSVRGCTSNHDPDKPYVSIFKIPKKPERKAVWLQALKMDPNSENSRIFVCILHFEDCHVVRKKLPNTGDAETESAVSSRSHLKSNAIPTKLLELEVTEEQAGTKKQRRRRSGKQKKATKKCSNDSSNEYGSASVEPGTSVWEKVIVSQEGNKICIRKKDDEDCPVEDLIQITPEELESRVLEKIAEYAQDENKNPILKLIREKEKELSKMKQISDEYVKVYQLLDSLRRNQERFLQITGKSRMVKSDASVQVDMPILLEEVVEEIKRTNPSFQANAPVLPKGASEKEPNDKLATEATVSEQKAESVAESLSSKTNAKKRLPKDWRNQFVLKQIEMIGSLMFISSEIRNSAFEMYVKISRNPTMQNRNNTCIAASCLLCACRKSGSFKTITEMAHAADLPKKEVGKGYKLVLKLLDMKADSPSVEDYISHFSDLCSLSEPTKELAFSIVQKALAIDDCSRNQSLLSISAACLLLASYALPQNEWLTLKTLCANVKVSVKLVTIAYRKLYQRASSLLPSDLNSSTLPNL